MARVSPTLEGFRTAFRRPSLTLAEIAWRWAVGAFAWALFFFWFIEYLDTLPVTRGDAALLSTRQPLLVGRAIAHILRGSLNRAVLAALLAVLALSLLWIVAASVGRATTLRALLDYFRKDVVNNVSEKTGEVIEPRPMRSLIGLNFLRAALALSAMLAFVGAGVLVSFASPKAHPQPGLAFILFLPLAGSISMVWSLLNWLLSLACIFSVRDGEDALGALFSAITLSRERAGPVFAVSAWTGLAHLTAFAGALSLASLPLAFIHVAPSRLVIVSVIVLTLAYLAVADWLYMARLAGYICIAEMPDGLLAPSPPMPRPAPSTLQVSIDRDEPILSDVTSASFSLVSAI
jgi:hypothetical protein